MTSVLCTVWTQNGLVAALLATAVLCCHHQTADRQLISNQHPQLIKRPPTGLYYCYVCRQTLEITSLTRDRLPNLNSSSVTPERLGALHSPPQYSTLRTVSYRRRCSTNQFCRSTARPRFRDDGRFFLNIYCKESMYSVGCRAARVCDNYRWMTRRHLDWELGING
jgi:hypothetical protein